jgi:urease subunit beta
VSGSREDQEADVTTPIGGYVLAADSVEINSGRSRLTLVVRNTGDRPIQVGSHFHFFEVNRALDFDRQQAFGWRLDIAAGTATRFEPGDQKEVTLVPFGGKMRVHGFNDLVDGWAPLRGAYRPRASEAFRRAEEFGFMSDGSPEPARRNRRDSKAVSDG